MEGRTWAAPVLPPLAAVIVAAPVVIAVTSPAADTVAMPALLVLNVIGFPVSWFPAESNAVTVSCTTRPMGIDTAVGCTSILATDADEDPTTATGTEALLPSLVAVMVAAPVLTAVTRPAADTVATATLLDEKVTV